mgnify:CR=1 FL=1
MAKKRKSGEGTLRKRADGRWEGRVVVGYDENNRAITKSVTAKERYKCLEKLEQLKLKCFQQVCQCLSKLVMKKLQAML